jgi:hypothetical protein
MASGKYLCRGVGFRDMRLVPRHLGRAIAAFSLLLLLASSSPGPGPVVARDQGASQFEVTDGSGAPLAAFTYGSRTVTVTGPQRTFFEDTAGARVVTSTHVRLLPEPFTGTVDQVWLESAIADASPDILDIAAQYTKGAGTITNAEGLRIAGDAGYGPRLADGTVQEGSDFNDYLGIEGNYPGKVDHPEPAQWGDMDCSGFVRMVFGYRGGIPLSLSPARGFLPRRSFEMMAAAPGTVIYKSNSQLKTFDAVQPGDLVFFDADADAAGEIDHVGIFVGMDTSGKHRFISSRKTADGPTLGDLGGRSILEGTGYYAKAFRAIRRL